VEELSGWELFPINCHTKRISYRIPTTIATKNYVSFANLRVGDVIITIYSERYSTELIYTFFKIVKKNQKSFRKLPCNIFGRVRPFEDSIKEDFINTDFCKIVHAEWQ
jgi:hypothetical protein